MPQVINDETNGAAPRVEYPLPPPLLTRMGGNPPLSYRAAQPGATAEPSQQPGNNLIPIKYAPVGFKNLFGANLPDCPHAGRRRQPMRWHPVGAG